MLSGKLHAFKNEFEKVEYCVKAVAKYAYKKEKNTEEVPIG